MAKIEFELEPWLVPNFVRVVSKPIPKETGIANYTLKDPIAISLEDLETSTLCQLCDEFRTRVFSKARKIDPTKTMTCST